MIGMVVFVGVDEGAAIGIAIPIPGGKGGRITESSDSPTTLKFLEAHRGQGCETSFLFNAATI